MRQIRNAIFWATLAIVSAISMTTKEEGSDSWWVLLIVNGAALIFLMNSTIFAKGDE